MNTLLDAVRTGRCDLVTALITPSPPANAAPSCRN